MTGVLVVLVAVAVALGFGGYRLLMDGRARPARAGRVARLDASRLGVALGRRATAVQFSSPVCAPCRATHRLLAELVAEDPDLAQVELDAETHLDLVAEFGITRTPTVLLLDPTGAVRRRIVGAARKLELRSALDELAGRPAA